MKIQSKSSCEFTIESMVKAVKSLLKDQPFTLDEMKCVELLKNIAQDPVEGLNPSYFNNKSVEIPGLSMEMKIQKH
jgi:hypothetical protein